MKESPTAPSKKTGATCLAFRRGQLEVIESTNKLSQRSATKKVAREKKSGAKFDAAAQPHAGSKKKTANAVPGKATMKAASRARASSHSAESEQATGMRADGGSSASGASRAGFILGTAPKKRKLNKTELEELTLSRHSPMARAPLASHVTTWHIFQQLTHAEQSALATRLPEADRDPSKWESALRCEQLAEAVRNWQMNLAAGEFDPESLQLFAMRREKAQRQQVCAHISKREACYHL
jgi:hypothetical protein